MAKVAEKLIIQIDVKDSEKAKKALKDIEVGFNRVGTRGKKDIGRLRLETEGLRRNLGQIRNNLLLVAFATEGLRRTFSGFAQARGQLEQFEARLRSMSGSAEIAQKQLKQFIDIAATTPFTVQEVVDGGVQLQAFGADAEALIPTMANLAAFMGRSVPEAANAFGRAFAGGRGAADVFRETGILAIIDDFESLDETLNKEKLSLTEFRIKMIEALSDPDGKIANGINELEGTLFQAFANMEDSVFMFRARVGEELQPFFLSLAKSVTNFFNAIDTDVIRDFGALLKVTFIGIASLAIQSLAFLAASALKASADMHLLMVSINGASASMATFNTVVKRNLFAILVTSIAAGVAIFDRLNNRVQETGDTFAEETKTVEEFIEELKKAQEAETIAEQNKLRAENIVKLQQQLDLLKATSAVEKEQVKQKRELSVEERQLIRSIEKRKEVLKEIQDIERRSKKFATEMDEIARENAVKRFGEGQARIELKGDEFKSFKDNEELMFKFSQEIAKKHEALKKLGLDKTIALGKVNLLDEKFREQAKIEIEENFQKKREEIIAESDRKINQMKDDDVLKQAEREALLLEQTRNFNLMVQDSYMQMFSQIQSAFANLVKSNMDQELKALRRTDKFRAASTEARQNMEDDIINRQNIDEIENTVNNQYDLFQQAISQFTGC